MTDHLTQLRLDEAPALLTPDPLIVRLHKVSSWEQSASRWPYYLARAEPDRVYTKKQIMGEIFQDDGQRQKRPEYGWLRSLYGVRVDREFQDVTIEGVGLFELALQSVEGYRITDDGLALAHAFSADRNSEDWKRVFAGILARNDVRVRAILLHLSRWGAYLTFRNGRSESAFFKLSGGGALCLSDGDEVQLFKYQSAASPAYSFTPLLQQRQREILGPFLARSIECAGVCVPDLVKFEGGRDVVRGVFDEPSANGLREYMKQALSLFRDIGALVYVEHRQGWTLAPERCAALFAPDLVADLFGAQQSERFLVALRSAYAKLRDGDGYVRVTDIRDYVADELDIPPGERVERFNAQVAYELRPDVGKLRLGRVFHAQATPDECLFGDLTMEYVEFLFVS